MKAKKPCPDCGAPICKASKHCRKCYVPYHAAMVRGCEKPEGFGEKIRRLKFNKPRPQIAGPKHPRWRGGNSSWRGEGWVIQRRAARVRDGNKCVECGETKNLQVHHIKDKTKTGGVWDNRLENLKTLCTGCHLKKHSRWTATECVK